jgi:hypothetical protein
MLHPTKCPLKDFPETSHLELLAQVLLSQVLVVVVVETQVVVAVAVAVVWVWVVLMYIQLMSMLIHPNQHL